MYFKTIKRIAALSLVAASVSTNATPLNDYNLILTGDFNVSGGSGHVEGKAFIGGNVVNGSVFAQHIDKSSTADTVKVVGNFTSNNAMHVEAGYVAYQGTFSGPTNICNGTGMGQSGCLKKVTNGSLTAEKNALVAELTSESNYFKSLATSANFAITGDSNNKTFKYTGAATNLAVFNIAGSDLANLNWSVDFGSALNVLINVSGNVFNAGNAHVNGFQNKANNVLWNFADATALNFGDSWYGSILALNATINTNSNLNGAIAAKSYVGNGEIHDYHWNYTPPTPPKPPVKVSEPSTLLLSLLGMGLLLVGRLRRQ
ncbi:choice-of-anchor A family protein [Cellvibrio sp.]|uniref:choice-of-anchor A family protein n=1 Tax=Cellvibrio sp. TaxID=1965322 RepID=UPI0039648C86